MRKIIKLKNARRIDDPSVRIKKIPVDGTTLTLFLDKNIKFIESPTRFIQYLERSDRYSSLTAQEYAKILKDFLLFLIYSEDVNKLDFDSIIASCGSLQIEEYISDLRSRGKRPKTIRTRDGCLKSFFDWLTTEEGGNHITRDNNPYSNGKLKSRSGQRDAIKYLTCQEFVEFIRNGLTNEFERCVAHFIFDTGARISEVRRVRLGDLPDIHQSHPDQTYFKILIRGSKAPGGGIKKRYSIISRAMLDRLSRMVNNYSIYRQYSKRQKGLDHCLYIQKNGKPFNHSSYQKKLNRVSNMLFEKGILSRIISAHMFRHGTALSILSSELANDFSKGLALIKNTFGHVYQETGDAYSSIPGPIFEEVKRDSLRKQIHKRFQEAEYIFDNTILPYNEKP